MMRAMMKIARAARAMVTTKRVPGNREGEGGKGHGIGEEGNGDNNDGDGDEGGGRALATRAMAMATVTAPTWVIVTTMRLAGDEKG